MRSFFISLCCALPVSAYAILPATPEQVLCNAGQIVIAEVISDKSADCRPQGRDCLPRDRGLLQIRIVDILAVGDEAAFQRFGAAIQDGKFIEAAWTLVHAMEKPGNLLHALDEFIAHPPSPINSVVEWKPS